MEIFDITKTLILKAAICCRGWTLCVSRVFKDIDVTSRGALGAAFRELPGVTLGGFREQCDCKGRWWRRSSADELKTAASVNSQKTEIYSRWLWTPSNHYRYFQSLHMPISSYRIKHLRRKAAIIIKFRSNPVSINVRALLSFLSVVCEEVLYPSCKDVRFVKSIDS